MASQREIWRAEHINPAIFTKIHSGKPSQPVVDFAQFLQEQGLVPAKTRILDIGCGKGRNAIYLASVGYRTWGIDFITEAIIAAKARAGNIQSEAQFETVDLTTRWPYQDGEFRAVIDCNTTIDIPNPGRSVAVSEAYRVLRSDGYYLFYGVGPTPLRDQPLGPEPNSIYFVKTGKFEKQYTKKELLETYAAFKVVSLEEVQGSDMIEGQLQHYPLWVAIFRK